MSTPDGLLVEPQRNMGKSMVGVLEKLPISLSGKRVCDSPSIRVSEISVYYKNRWVVPMLGKDLFNFPAFYERGEIWSYKGRACSSTDGIV